MQVVTPYNNQDGKKEQVEDMFDSIAGKYDFLNHFLSFGIDRFWRGRMIKALKPLKPKTVLDVATGTGDLAISASKIIRDKIVGIDLSEKMMEVGRAKIKKLQLDDKIFLEKGDAENLRFEDNSFDVVMVAFGIRNFENLEKGLKEILRVLKPNGMFAVLEFSKPVIFPVKQIYGWYSKKILPMAGKKISGDSRAYTYLPESVMAFPEGDRLVSILSDVGFVNARFKPLTFRIASLYFARKG